MKDFNHVQKMEGKTNFSKRL